MIAMVEVLRGLFVTGTDTGVGKTVVSAALMQRYREGIPLRYWKPIQTGAGIDDDRETVRALAAGASGEAILEEGVRLPHPVSPHLAARLSGTRIAASDVADLGRRQAAGYRWIVEGAGGVLVPINETERMADLIRMLQLPALVVSRSTLGTINHTALTIEALRARSLPIAGVVMVGPLDRENREAIEQYTGVPVVGEMPLFPTLTPDVVHHWATTSLDRGNRLVEWLG